MVSAGAVSLDADEVDNTSEEVVVLNVVSYVGTDSVETTELAAVTVVDP